MSPCYSSLPPSPASTRWRADLYLVLAQERGRPGPPQQLAEPVLVVLLQEAALEGPQPVRIVHLQEEGGSATTGTGSAVAPEPHTHLTPGGAAGRSG